MSPRNLLWPLVLSGCLISACGPAETPTSQSGLAAIEERLSGIEARLEANTSNDPLVEGEAVKSMAVQPPAFALNVGSQQKIELITLTTDAGETSVLTGFNVVEFSMEDTEIAAVSKSGEITALKPGTTILEIRLGAMTKSLPVVVTGGAVATPTPAATPVPAATATPTPTPTPTATPLPSNNIKSISISPDEMDLEINETQVISKIFVTLNDADGTIGALNSVELAELSSSNTAVAKVSANGVVTGVSEGSTTIVATYKGVRGTLSVTVAEDEN